MGDQRDDCIWKNDQEFKLRYLSSLIVSLAGGWFATRQHDKWALKGNGNFFTELGKQTDSVTDRIVRRPNYLRANIFGELDQLNQNSININSCHGILQ